MTEQEFAEILAFGREQRGIEFKGPGSRSDKRFLARVVRAVMAMANRRDGGRVILGVDEADDGGLVATGLSPEELKTWNHDDLADSLAEYADPFVTFDVRTVIYQGKSFVLVAVEEFETIPILCKRDFQDPANGRLLLRRGVCYVRSARKPESIDVSSHADLRELLDLATSKSVRKFIGTAEAVGFSTSGRPSDAELFDAQLGDFGSSDYGQQIRSRGYWQVVIRPEPFVAERLDNIAALAALVEQCSVQRRGWNFPHLDRKTPVHIDRDWVGQEFLWQQYLEIWRFYQSGQFVFLGGMPYDWRDSSSLWPVPAGWTSGRYLDVVDTVWTITEFFEFASRLCTAIGNVDRVAVSVTVSNVKDRILSTDHPSRRMVHTYRTGLATLTSTASVPLGTLAGGASELAIDAALEIFRRFGWDPERELLRDLQSELGRR
jgi:hypothetical protein